MRMPVAGRRQQSTSAMLSRLLMAKDQQSDDAQNTVINSAGTQQKLNITDSTTSTLIPDIEDSNYNSMQTNSIVIGDKMKQDDDDDDDELDRLESQILRSQGLPSTIPVQPKHSTEHFSHAKHPACNEKIIHSNPKQVIADRIAELQRQIDSLSSSTSDLQ